MSRRGDGSLFVGRLSKDTRTRDLEDIFEVYGRLTRCDIKYGAEMAYAFMDYEDRRDAEDAIKFENGRDVRGSSIIVEWAKGSPRRPLVKGFDECYRCQRPGHWARDCPGDRNRRRSPSPSYRSSYRRRSRSRSRDKRRSRSRERRHRSRSRSRSRDHRRSRSRSSDRGSSGRRAGSENGSRRSRSDSRD